MIVKKRVKIEDLFKALNMNDEEKTWDAPKSLKVLSENNKYEKVIGLYKTDKRDVVTSFILNEDNMTTNHVTGVPEHRIKSGNDWTYLKDLTLSDMQIDIKDSNGVFKKTIEEEEKQNCYDLQVDNTHSFYTNDILSHNTEMFLTILKLTQLKTLILFARVQLANDSKKRATDAGLDTGIVQGKNLDENHQIVMSTVQSSHKLQQDYDLVIVDECHRASAAQYQELLAKDFKYRLGFSATPLVKDKYKSTQVKMWLGDVLMEIPAEKLIGDKQLSKPTIHILPINRPIGLENKLWQSAERNGIVKNSYRNKVIAELVGQLKNQQVLVLVKAIEQGDTLNSLIPNSIFLSGQHKNKDRDEVLNRFRDGERFTLIASTIFDEGIDIKNVNSVIVCAGGASYVKTLQRLGRGTRILRDEKGKIIKDSVDIFDFLDETNPILERHSMTRIKHYKKEGFTDVKYWKDDTVKKLSGRK